MMLRSHSLSFGEPRFLPSVPRQVRARPEMPARADGQPVRIEGLGR